MKGRKTILRVVAMGVLAVALAVLVTPTATEANAEEANFRDLGTFTTPSLTVGSVTVTGSNLVNVLNINGLGIVGGQFDSTIDPGETISFSFADPASNVRVVLGCAAGDRNGDGLLLKVRLEAFDGFGTSLGQVDTFPGTCLIDFSGILGVDPMSRLDVTMILDGIRIGGLAFDTGPADSDGDGVPDADDACPSEDSTGFDADNDGCIDSIQGLNSLIDTLFAEGVIDSMMLNSLHAKIDAALASLDRDNVCTAINQLNALKEQIEAQTGKKVSEDAAPELLQYITNVQTFLVIASGVGSC